MFTSNSEAVSTVCPTTTPYDAPTDTTSTYFANQFDPTRQAVIEERLAIREAWMDHQFGRIAVDQMVAE